VARRSEVVSDTDDAADHFSYDAEISRVIDIGGSITQRGIRTAGIEETHVEAVRGQASVKSKQRLAIIGPDRPDAESAPVAENYVGFELSWVGRNGHEVYVDRIAISSPVSW
jgi:hypothetical protein